MPEPGAAAFDRRAHWQRVHETKSVHEVSWWQTVPRLSLDLIERAGLAPRAAIIDVGAGASTLVDHLVARGFQDLTVLDISPAALATVSRRLGTASSAVNLQVADVLDFAPDRRFALWHDRAVFHFLTAAEQRDAYRAALLRCLEPGGYLAVATFGPEGPHACSGLPTSRYSPSQLAAQFPGFVVVAEAGDEHTTPRGSTQQFTGLLLRRGT